MKEIFQNSIMGALLFNEETMGALYYYLFRGAENTYFLKFFDSAHQLNNILHPAFIALGNSLPTFVHVLAFTMITASLIVNNNKGYALVCFVWFGVDVLFEVGQGLDFIIIGFIPEWFSQFLFLENVKNYFLYGQFDYFDLLSIGLGSSVAYLLLIVTKN